MRLFVLTRVVGANTPNEGSILLAPSFATPAVQPRREVACSLVTSSCLYHSVVRRELEETRGRPRLLSARLPFFSNPLTFLLLLHARTSVRPSPMSFLGNGS